jgi:hypothetical protein
MGFMGTVSTSVADCAVLQPAPVTLYVTDFDLQPDGEDTDPEVWSDSQGEEDQQAPTAVHVDLHADTPDMAHLQLPTGKRSKGMRNRAPRSSHPPRAAPPSRSSLKPRPALAPWAPPKDIVEIPSTLRSWCEAFCTINFDRPDPDDDKEQLQRLIELLGMYHKLREVADFCRDNIDWFVNFDELVRVLALAVFRHVFQDIDKNGDGTLTRREFVSGMREKGFSGPLEAMFDQADDYGDGVVSRQDIFD